MLVRWTLPACVIDLRLDFGCNLVLSVTGTVTIHNVHHKPKEPFSVRDVLNQLINTVGGP